MENKINIVELLKDCHSGLELDCTLFDDVHFDSVDEVCDIIKCYIKDSHHKIGISFDKYGHYSNIRKAKCVIFPKGKTTWEGFVPPCKFKNGDIMATDSGMWVGIVKKLSNHDVYEVYVGVNTNNTNSLKYFNLSFSRLATEEEKAQLFQAIKDNGYQWNTETKTLEKLIEPKFKVGDRIKYIDARFCIRVCVYTVVKIEENRYIVNRNNEPKTFAIDFKTQDDWELAPNKFDISNLKPFDKVLVRCSSLEKWHIQFFEKYNTELGAKYPFICLCYNKYSQCIPYENNQHLLDTANDCNDFYKTWE